MNQMPVGLDLEADQIEDCEKMTQSVRRMAHWQEMVGGMSVDRVQLHLQLGSALFLCALHTQFCCKGIENSGGMRK